MQTYFLEYNLNKGIARISVYSHCIQTVYQFLSYTVICCSTKMIFLLLFNNLCVNNLLKLIFDNLEGLAIKEFK